jgi:cephalosporin hydroxylase
MAIQLPPAVSVDLEKPAIGLWRERARQVLYDSYAGIPLWKFPEDLRVYEHILWARDVEVVLEVGTLYGGSALWFRDRLRTLAAYGRIAQPKVISVDLHTSNAEALLAQADPGYRDQITLLAGDVMDASFTQRVRRTVRPDASCLVIDDSAHTYETTMACLRGFSDLIQPKGFFVVEDGCVDIEEMRIDPNWPRGVLAAIRDWLGTDQGGRFRQRRDMELYGISCHPGGFLERSA